mmetsp:Transcript_7847/g.5889  ORF Transcript_7847/g.5889 Transcript_7847/m.5889 type:complete len:111 (+) Transcript_7847:935-1267(+)
MKMLKRSVDNVKAAITKLSPPYDITNWAIAVSASNPNDNIIHGILKHGVPIKIVIRPTDFSRLLFHNEVEVNALKEAGSELWGDNDKTTRQIMLGEVVYWNEIKELKVDF